MSLSLQQFIQVSKRSSFAYALALFVLLNLAVGKALKDGCQDAPEHGLFWWKTRAYQKATQSPPIVLMGSCVLSSALNLGDVRYLNMAVDPAVNQHCYVLEHVLQSRLKRNLPTFSYSLSGMMMSDAFAVAKVNFTATKHPEVLVLCIAPRDFLDNGLQNVLASPTARYMNRLSCSSIFPDGELPQQSMLEKLAGTLSLVQHREDILSFEKSVERAAVDFYFDDLLQRHAVIKPQRISDVELSLCGCQNVRLGEDTIYPANGLSCDFADNELEYRLRYLPYHHDAFLKQLSYLERLLNYCGEIGTHVAIVNMPLLPENLALLPKGAYSEFLTSISRQASFNHAIFFDLNQSGMFDRSDFKTPVHLNGAGGIKFSTLLSTVVEATMHNESQMASLSTSVQH